MESWQSYINQSGNVIGADVEKPLPSIQMESRNHLRIQKEGNNFSEFGVSKLSKPRAERL